MNFRVRSLVVCAAIALCVLPSGAAADQRPVQVMIGATFAHIRFDDAANLGVSWRGNATFGIDFGVPVFNPDSKVQLRGEALLVPRGGNVDDGQFVRKIKLLYIDVAGLVDVEVNPSVHLLAGASLGIRAGGAASVNGLAVDITGVFRPFDVGLTFGADVVLVPRKVQMQVLYIHGLMNILSDSPYTPIFFNSTSPARNQTLLIMVSPGFWR